MIGNRQVEGRVCTILLHVIRKSLTPCDNRLTAILVSKSLVSSGIQTPAQTECHRSTTYANNLPIEKIVQL